MHILLTQTVSSLLPTLCVSALRQLGGMRENLKGYLLKGIRGLSFKKKLVSNFTFTNLKEYFCPSLCPRDIKE